MSKTVEYGVVLGGSARSCGQKSTNPPVACDPRLSTTALGRLLRSEVPPPPCRSQSLAPLGAPPLIPVGCGTGQGAARRDGPTLGACGRCMTSALPHAPAPHRVVARATSTIPLAIVPPPSPCPPPPRVAPSTLARAHRHAPAPHHGVCEHLCRRRRHRRCPWVRYVAISCMACCVWVGRAIPFCSLTCDAVLMALTLLARVHL